MTDQSSDTNANQPTESQETPVVTPATSLEGLLTSALEEVKRPDGSQKYSSPEDFIRSAVEAQTFIPQLQTEKKAMSESLESMQARLQAVEAEKVALASKLEQTLSLTPKPATEQAVPSAQPGVVDVEAIKAEILQGLQQQQVEKTYESNRNAVLQTLTSTFGDSASEITKKVIEEQFAGNTEAFTSLASQSPKAVESILNAYKPAQQPLPASASLTGMAKPTATGPVKGDSPLNKLPGESSQAYIKRVMPLMHS